MTSGTMRAWRVERPGPIGTRPLGFVRAVIPEPGRGEVLVRVLACGVCRTDLHVAEGDLPVRRRDVVPGHEIVGEVVALGPGVRTVGAGVRTVGAGVRTDGAGVRTPTPGDRVGGAWLHRACGTCRYCASGAENLCPRSVYTGWDVDGGYAEYAVLDAGHAYPLPAGYDDLHCAPLLCAGIIGYRALQRTDLPPGGRLGIYGFGGSAHLTAQVALARGARVHVMTRDAAARELALHLGASSATGAADPPPEPLDAAILFAPVGELVLPALEALDRGGILAVAGIHLSEIPPLTYERHLFYEKQIRSVTSYTRADALGFLDFAGRHRIDVTTVRYRLDRADDALADLAAGRFAGAAVLVP